MYDITKPPKIFISTPCYDCTMTMQYTISILKLSKFLNEKGIEFVIDFNGNESLIPRARNSALGKFMQTDFTHLFFIDSDIQFEPEAVLDLIIAQKDVACCAYPKKEVNFKRFIYSIQNDQKSNESLESRGLDYAYNAMYDASLNVITDGKLIKVAHASTGFMMIQRNIIEKLYEKHKELIITNTNADHEICGLFCCMIKDTNYLSEDYSFCQRVYDIGGEVWINISHNLSHVGKYVYSGDIKNRKYHGRLTSEKMFYPC